MHDDEATTTTHVGNVVIVDAAELPSNEPLHHEDEDTPSHDSSESPASNHDQSNPSATGEPDNRHVEIHLIRKQKLFLQLIQSNNYYNNY